MGLQSNAIENKLEARKILDDFSSCRDQQRNEKNECLQIIFYFF